MSTDKDKSTISNVAKPGDVYRIIHPILKDSFSSNTVTVSEIQTNYNNVTFRVTNSSAMFGLPRSNVDDSSEYVEFIRSSEYHTQK